MSKKAKIGIAVVLVIVVAALLVVLFTDLLGPEETMEPENDVIEEEPMDEVEPDDPDVLEDEVEFSAHLRVEGINENIFGGEVTVPADEAFALDVLTSTLDEEGIEYETEDFEGSPMLTSVDGEDEGTFGETDGWLFMVNNEMAPVGAGEYLVEENDELVFFYGDYPPETLIPEVETDPSVVEAGEDFTVTVTSTYMDFATEEMVTEEIEDATVLFEGEEYTTDENGEAEINAVDTDGTYELEVRKDRDDNYPAIVRTGDTIQIDIR